MILCQNYFIKTSKKLNIDNFTPRLALQLMGTEVLRNHFHEDIWLNSLEYRLRMRHQTDPCVVVSDARFSNELQLIKQMNGFVIWVQRGDLPEWYDIAKTSQTNAVNRNKGPRTAAAITPPLHGAHK